jgi:UrcA family protein
MAVTRREGTMGADEVSPLKARRISMNTPSITRSAFVAIVAAGAAFATIAPAAAADGAPEAHIRLGSFNAANAADQKALERKIRSAARQVCPERDSSDLAERLEARRCIAAAMKSGNDQLAAITASNGTALAQLNLRGVHAK